LKVLVTGARGLVGRAVAECCSESGDDVLSFTHNDLDIADPQAVFKTIHDNKPDVVINCAAWTDVDGCESDQTRAFAVNAEAPRNLANACKEIECVFLTISTDYVFDGEKEGFYTQQDHPNPQSVYAGSKLEGERRAALAYDRSIIVRTGYVFGPGGTNFLSSVIARARRGDHLKAISDTYGTPTYAKDLATRLRELSVLNVPGIYHVVNSGPGVSFEQFTRKAVEIIPNSNAVVEGITDSALSRPAKRPRNSRLRCLFTQRIGLSPLRDWESALVEFVAQDSEGKLI
jgi:dTDP-4-dehydrorhamnose reductase